MNNKKTNNRVGAKWEHVGCGDQARRQSRPLLADTATKHWEPLSKDQEPKSPFACAPRCRRDGNLAVRARRFDHWCRSCRLDDHRLQIVGRVHPYLARSGRPRAAT